MIILYLSKDDEKSEKIKSIMTDEMWSQYIVKYCDQDNYLEFPHGTKIVEHDKIVSYLKSETVPPVRERVRSARNAAVQAYKTAIKTGSLKANKEVVENRRSICKQCPYAKNKFFGDVCLKCGCIIKPKTMLLTQSCPIDKW